jgi:hypothetical protein
MGEMLVADNERKRQADGATPRDLSMYSAWRESASPDNLDLMVFYARYLAGQFAGMSSALSLDAVKSAMEIDGIDRDEWPEMAQRLIRLHSLVEEHRPKGDG